MASKKGLGIGNAVGNVVDKIGDILTPKPTIESPVPAKKQSASAPGNAANPDQSVRAVKTRRQQLEEIK